MSVFSAIALTTGVFFAADAVLARCFDRIEVETTLHAIEAGRRTLVIVLLLAGFAVLTSLLVAILVP